MRLQAPNQPTDRERYQAMRDERLSYRARGLLGYIWTLDEGDELTPFDLGEVGPEGQAAIRRALDELREAGYLAPKARRCEVCGGLQRPGMSWTYAVARQGWVKIGATSDPESRLQQLQKGGVRAPEGMDLSQPLVSLRLVEGDIEHDLHERFAEQHVVGEWFVPVGEVAAWLGASA